jgi:hypothetical protein
MSDSQESKVTSQELVAFVLRIVVLGSLLETVKAREEEPAKH